MFIRTILLAILFYLVYALIAFVVRSFNAKQMQPPPEKTSAGEDMVRDPQCGTYVPRSDALRSREHYFCSEKCRDEFADKQKNT